MLIRLMLAKKSWLVLDGQHQSRLGCGCAFDDGRESRPLRCAVDLEKPSGTSLDLARLATSDRSTPETGRFREWQEA